jgi:hypothetical protein
LLDEYTMRLRAYVDRLAGGRVADGAIRRSEVAGDGG